MSVPNQKIVKIGSKSKGDKTHPNMNVSVDVIKNVCCDLSGEAIKLWLYLAKNNSGFELELSQKACEDFGLKKDTYYRAVKQLEEKGYLAGKAGSNKYIFHEVAEESADKKWEF